VAAAAKHQSAPSRSSYDAKVRNWRLRDA